ncbi:MAG TPA: NusG domain II-containing protein [Coriobacteriia bacterium]|nr:NusG domain II-containing protein [Coriobacteriia bacterium]
MSRTDRILILVLACIALVATPTALALEHGRAAKGDVVIVEGPEGVTRLPLGTDVTATIGGAGGTLEVEVLGGAVRVAEADCPDLTCVKTGWVRAPGSAIVCLPNGVTVRIGGVRDDGLDAIVR